MPVVNLEQKLAGFAEHWSPKIVAGFNGHDVMVVKARGEFVWHSHRDTDDLFLVFKGRLTIQLRDSDVHLGPGDLYVVPKGVEHRPVAEEEVHLLLMGARGHAEYWRQGHGRDQGSHLAMPAKGCEDPHRPARPPFPVTKAQT